MSNHTALIQDLAYFRGDAPRIRLNSLVKAAGLSYPSSNAVGAIGAPAASLGSAPRMYVCCRHATKLNPVSRRNKRVKVRRLKCSELAQSPMLSFAVGCSKNLRQRRASAWSVGSVASFAATSSSAQPVVLSIARCRHGIYLAGSMGCPLHARHLDSRKSATRTSHAGRGGKAEPLLRAQRTR